MTTDHHPPQHHPSPPSCLLSVSLSQRETKSSVYPFLFGPNTQPNDRRHRFNSGTLLLWYIYHTYIRYVHSVHIDQQLRLPVNPILSRERDNRQQKKPSARPASDLRHYSLAQSKSIFIQAVQSISPSLNHQIIIRSCPIEQGFSGISLP